MQRRFLQLSGVLGACLVATPLAAQRDFSGVEIRTIPVADGVYMLMGSGGNIGLSVGEDGPFVVDDQFAGLTEKILAAIAATSWTAMAARWETSC